MNESDREEFWIELEAQNFADAIDVILYKVSTNKMTLKNAVTKGVKAWRDRRVGYWLCIDPKTGEYYLLTSANLAELNGLKAMYRLPAVYYRAVLTRNWNVKLGPHVIGTHLDTSAYIEDLDGFFDRIAIKKRLSYQSGCILAWGPLRSRIRVLPPRDPPGDGGRREGGRNVFFKLSKRCTLKR